ncbi:putative amino-acid permease C11D3.08c [Mycena venus]|uniref:Putative amino-acid permease C11D3.08c n=1 Tax=Mycena venus TaxID=2733690 RepID=A0A8H6XP68_9AGAR|nr:putative amino-acid permease C11D3.08c [Mycena venus]
MSSDSPLPTSNGDSKSADDTTILASLGYKQELKRHFTILELFGFSFSLNAAAPAVAATLYYSIPYGGSSAMVWGWAVSSLFIMIIAMAMAELGSAAPTSGGIYYWTYNYSSPRYRNILCWIVGYINTITYISGVAGSTFASASAIMAAATIGSDGRFIPTIYQTYGVFIGILVTCAVFASCATRALARVQNCITALNIILVLVILIGMPAATPAELKNTAKYVFGHFENLTPWPNGYAFILSFLAPLWAVGGFDSGVHISEEALNANVAVPWAMVSALGVDCTIGFAFQIALAFCMGTDTIDILSSPVQQPLSTILLNSLGKKGFLAVWTFIFIALYLGSVELMVATSRQIFAFSRDGALIFSPFLYNINPTTGTPVRGVLFTAICVALLGLVTFAGPAATGAIFSLGVVGQYTANSVPIAARVFGGQPFVPGPFSLGAFSIPIALTAVVWMLFMTVVLMFPSAPDPTAMTMNYTSVVFGGVLLLSVGYYYLPMYGGVHWFRGPIANVELRKAAEEKDVYEGSTEKI